MKEKKLTDEEIINCLYECGGDLRGCVGCKLKEFGNCDELILEAIKRLQSENERLKKQIDELPKPRKKILANRVYSDTTLKSWTKEQLIEQIRILEHNWSVAEESLNNSVKNSDKIFYEQKAEIERLTEELKNLDWYKMWHNKFKKEINDLTLELETYRPTKLSGNGQCKCSNCNHISWTDWFSRYKGKTLCDECLKEIISKENKQIVKDTAKEIFTELLKDENIEEYERFDGYYDSFIAVDEIKELAKERYGVEVE